MQHSQSADLSRAVGKAGWRILPLLSLGYLFAYIDRVNVSFASTQMNLELGFSATVYGFGAGMFYLAYSLVEIPSNILLMRFGARRWLARIMIMWGLLAMLMAFVTSPMQFYALRFLLGLAEAGFFPGVIYYLSTWFPGQQRGKAVGMFYLANPIAIAVIGVVSGPLLALHGAAGLSGWQWLFLVEGFPAAFIGIAVLLWLPDKPETVGWLSQSERAGLVEALAKEGGGEVPHGTDTVLACLADRKVQLLALVYLLTLASATTFILSGPAILMERTGWKLDQVGPLISIGGLTAAAFMLLTGWFTDRRGERFSALFLALGLDVAGYLTVALAPSAGIAAAGFIVSQIGRGMHSTAQATLWTDLFSSRRLAVGAAAISTVANLATFLMPFGFGAAKDATGSYAAGLLAIPVCNALALIFAYVLFRNLRKPAH